jgi:hypothetical protein
MVTKVRVRQGRALPDQLMSYLLKQQVALWG